MRGTVSAPPEKISKSQTSKEPSLAHKRQLPIGTELLKGGGAHFRVWAPKASLVEVELSGDLELKQASRLKLESEPHAYFSGYIAEARAGMFYRFRLKSGSFPDPASRFQPEGPHGPSEIIDGSTFEWTDTNWKGVSREGQVIYEMHIGTFTPEGTWAAASEQLEELAKLGITMLEVMPVADFPGRFGWGYDGVNMFAPTRLYGRPDDFRAFINRAHALGMGVILDVVYNHLGPDGNYLKEFSEDYFTDRYPNEWGEPLNFDGPNSGPVREFFIANARYWIDEFHLDGLRLDATQQIFDSSSKHILLEIGEAVREAPGSRSTYIVAENELQHVKLVRTLQEGGYGLDALWNDDFHHAARVALTGRSEAYYTDYKGTPQEFISAIKWGFLYQGQYYTWQKKRRGTPAFGLHPSQFVTFIQNHDQVANSLRGERIHHLAGPGQLKALTALLLLAPPTPMLFQGQEFAASTPFHYFADHNPELAKLVAKGRGDFLRQFPSINCPEADPYVVNPESETTFRACKLDLAEREKHADIYRLHKELLKLRREDPVFRNPRPGGVDGAVLGPEAFVLRFFGGENRDRLLIVNLGADLHLHVTPEPLLAPMEGRAWKLIWSSESPCYGGCGTPAIETEQGWRIPGRAAVVMAAEELEVG